MSWLWLFRELTDVAWPFWSCSLGTPVDGATRRSPTAIIEIATGWTPQSPTKILFRYRTPKSAVSRCAHTGTNQQMVYDTHDNNEPPNALNQPDTQTLRNREPRPTLTHGPNTPKLATKMQSIHSVSATQRTPAGGGNCCTAVVSVQPRQMPRQTRRAQ